MMSSPPGVHITVNPPSPVYVLASPPWFHPSPPVCDPTLRDRHQWGYKRDKEQAKKSSDEAKALVDDIQYVVEHGLAKDIRKVAYGDLRNALDTLNQCKKKQKKVDEKWQPWKERETRCCGWF
jgi:hypothetical protein